MSASLAVPVADAPAAGSQVERLTRLEVTAALLAKASGMANVVVAVVSAATHYPVRPGPTLLAVGVGVETAVFALLALRARRVTRLMVAVDGILCTGALALNGILQSSGLLHNWGFFMYPFSLVTTVIIGIGFDRLLSVCAWTAAVAGAYFATGTQLVGDPPWNDIPNAVSYLAIGPVAWAVDAELSRMARRADASRAEAVSNAAVAARERERNRHQRMLHDHVLQTLEMLAHGNLVADRAVQARIAEDAVWLRGLVDGADQDRPGDLATALSAVVQRQARDGLQVDVAAADLLAPDGRQHRLDGEAAEALLGAAYEALTNVRKHAGVTRATLRAAVEDRHMVISVLDQGRGFDPATRAAGVGLAHSVRARMRDAGGEALVESAPGEGTYIELRMPLGTPGEA